MKKICSFFSRLIHLFFSSLIPDIEKSKVGFDIEDPFEGLEYQGVHKRNLQDNDFNWK